MAGGRGAHEPAGGGEGGEHGQREGEGADAGGGGEGGRGGGAGGEPDAGDGQGAPGDGAGDRGDRGLGGAEPGQVAGGPSRGPQPRVLARGVRVLGVVNVSRQRKPQDRARPGGAVVGAVSLHDDGLAEQGPGGGAVEGQGQRGQQGEAGDGKGDPDGGQ